MSVAKTIGRRLFARAAVGVPTALKMGGQHAPPPRGIASCGVPAATVGSLSPAEIVKQEFRSKVWSALRTKSRPLEEEQSIQYSRRMMMGGLDPDLAVLNSMSLARRVQIQCDREVELREKNRGLRAWIIRSMGGKPEDFE